MAGDKKNAAVLEKEKKITSSISNCVEIKVSKGHFQSLERRFIDDHSHSIFNMFWN